MNNPSERQSQEIFELWSLSLNISPRPVIHNLQYSRKQRQIRWAIYHFIIAENAVAMTPRMVTPLSQWNSMMCMIQQCRRHHLVIIDTAESMRQNS